jgi:hypothetical protein
MTRVEHNKPANIDQAFYVDGVLTDADGPVTVTVTRADGTAIVTDAATTNLSVGVYRYALAAQNLNLLTFTYTGVWSGATVVETQHVEIVGDFYFDLDAARAADAAFASTTDYSTAEIVRVRAEVEDAIEAAAGVAFVRRFARHALDGAGTATLLLPHMHPRSVLSVRTYAAATTFTTYTADELAALVVEPSGLLRRWAGSFLRGNGNIVVEYEHGFDAPPPIIRRAALLLLRYWLRANKVASVDPSLMGVSSLSVEGYRVSWANGAGAGVASTGVGEVDRLIEAWKGSMTAGSVAIA